MNTRGLRRLQYGSDYNVSLTASRTITQDDHLKTFILNAAAGLTITLSPALGNGLRFRVIVGTTITSNSYIIQVANTTDTIAGIINILDNDSNAQTAYSGTGTDDTITLNGTTTGGVIGDWLEFCDITAAGKWAVIGNLLCPAGSNVADVFSAAV